MTRAKTLFWVRATVRYFNSKWMPYAFITPSKCTCKTLKAVPLHATKALRGERRYSSYSFLTSALDGGEWSVSCPLKTLLLTIKGLSIYQMSIFQYFSTLSQV
jgi:hypothetical protein